ncbi:MAG: 16S rRNA (cytidine(1402)-2'-O)-methyltransferase [Lachnospiraceae bacterium]|nr:16S rRNA (cytidine(1402)-2'-O)-methyltransferase [Lachnospiraceae bacterium]MBR6487134.1 16S rRNA (cytidine(1402)-2'-O)-methyltransferase [Lachnospiraceae bacterium]
MTGDIKQGILYLCATPIGNLSDITRRVIDTLREVDIIAAEDTRNSKKLLNHYDINTPLTSYHEHNRYDKAAELIVKLKEGKNIALITDAGTPGISDPGEVFVKMCMDEGIRVTSLPGACALITALTMSGLKTRRFCFEAFLPADKKERREILKELTTETRTIIIYEAPHHLKKTLGELGEILGNRRISLCRELTKQFEEVLSFTIDEAIEYYSGNEPRGEYVLCIEGRDRQELEAEEIRSWQDITIKEHMKLYEDKGLDRKEAMKAVAVDRGISKREVYNELI